MEHEHANYYTRLLERRCNSDPTLTVSERRELDLHLLICRQCKEHYAQLQRSQPSLSLQTLHAKLEAPLPEFKRNQA